MVYCTWCIVHVVFSQFGQFDYGQQQQQQPSAAADPSNPYMNNPGGYTGGYTGSIMTPDPVQGYGQDNNGGENYDDEPPLMEGQ